MAVFARQRPALSSEDTVGLIEEGEVVLWEANSPTERAAARWQRVRRAALSLSVAGLLAVAIGAAVTQPSAVMQEADVGSGVGLSGTGLLSALADSIETASQLVKDVKSSKEDAEKSWSEFRKPLEEIKKEALAENITAEKLPKDVVEKLKHLHGDALLGKGNQAADGNRCPDDEEELTGLCYRKCSDLTEGLYPIRTTAFACCRERPCSIFNTKFTSPLKFCTGNDVAGRREGGACPHVPGDCLRNEEFLLGHCFKQCAILTDDKFTFRTGSTTCCKYKTQLACLDPINSVSSANFSVGGGVNDPKYDSTYGEAHMPIPSIAEVQTTWLPTVPPLPTLPQVVTVTPFPVSAGALSTLPTPAAALPAASLHALPSRPGIDTTSVPAGALATSLLASDATTQAPGLALL